MKRPFQKKLFTGFSTYDAGFDMNITHYDVDLIKRDLLNHFNTRIGERVMRPEYGCRIWDYLYEPLNHVRDDIVSEAVRICNNDSRVSVQYVNVEQLDNGLRVEISLTYALLDVTDTFSLDFERRQNAEITQN